MASGRPCSGGCRRTQFVTFCFAPCSVCQPTVTQCLQNVLFCSPGSARYPYERRQERACLASILAVSDTEAWPVCRARSVGDEGRVVHGLPRGVVGMVGWAGGSQRPPVLNSTE